MTAASLTARERFVRNLIRAVADSTITQATAVDYLAEAGLTAAPATFAHACDTDELARWLRAGLRDDLLPEAAHSSRSWSDAAFWRDWLAGRYEADVADAVYVLAQPYDTAGVAA